MNRKKAKQMWLFSIVFYGGALLFVILGEGRIPLSPILFDLILILATIPLLCSYHQLSHLKQLDLEQQVRERTEELEKALQTAESASQSKSDFLANMSHELRTPLNAILGFSSAMQHEAFGPINSPVYREYAARIYKSGEHLLSLINDILDLSKIEANKQQVKSEWIDIDNVLSDVLKIVSGYPEAEKRKIKVVDHDPFPKLLADIRLLRQVLLNLLSNAVKFTKDNGRIFIDLDINERGDFLLSVSDNGIGIPADKLSAIMTPFVQVENVMTRTHKGSGLGLSLVDRIMHLHGGRVDIKSQLGEGTTVTLIFPAMRVEKFQDIVIG